MQLIVPKESVATAVSVLTVANAHEFVDEHPIVFVPDKTAGPIPVMKPLN